VPRIELTVKLTPDEFRSLLSPKLQGLFDHLVKKLTENIGDERHAKHIVAELMLDTLRKEGDI